MAAYPKPQPLYPFDLKEDTEPHDCWTFGLILRSISFCDALNKSCTHLLVASSTATEVLEGDKDSDVPKNLSSLEIYNSPWAFFSCFTRSCGLLRFLEQTKQRVSLIKACKWLMCRVILFTNMPIQML